ncbi:MAG: hypothetical protein QM784_26850 [Polyangiaceae bacterium]
MPRRDDIHKILLIGSGPIVIGQACEFDYSGTQGAKALTSLGYDVVLVNSNPATIMTDPELVRRTYVEPLDHDTLAAIIERERPDALLPTLGGQTALNLALSLHESGVLSKYGVRLIGAQIDSIRKAEDRLLFKEAMKRAGLECPRSGYARSVDEARKIAEMTGYPIILRPSFTSVAPAARSSTSRKNSTKRSQWVCSTRRSTRFSSKRASSAGRNTSSKSFGTRTTTSSSSARLKTSTRWASRPGDFITVAPSMTLTDREYQRLRDAARAVMHEIGVETGGSNVQFAVCPKTGRVLVIEMNPRVVPGRRPRKRRATPSRIRGQARGRVHPRRAHERHHGNQRRIRTDHRLRGRQVAKVRLREVPWRGLTPRAANEERR